MINSPCKDCKDRKLHCHSSCTKYADFKKAKQEEKKALYKYREESDIVFKSIQRSNH